MRRVALLAGGSLLVVAGCASSLNDTEWTWCQAHPDDILLTFDRLRSYSERIDWYFANNSEDRTNADTIEVCKAAYAAR